MLTPLAAAVVAALNPAGPAIAQEETETIEVILVTATKRELNLQDVPHSIDVVSAAELTRMGAKDLEATLRALPSINITALQPGQNSLVVRGISTGPFEYRTEAQVAVYLDEQPMTFNSQQVGIRNIDMARIEALPGPQGTLFGSSSQTGTIRYITNKPTTSGFLGQVEARYGTTKGGSGSYDLSGFLNIPIADNFAIRGVGYTSLDGGYVDNVYGTSFTGNYDNADKVENDFNEYEVDGGRIHALWNVTDNWSALFSIVAENTKADGVWDTDEALGDYKVTRFEDEVRTDDWYSAAITLNGNLGFADLSLTATKFDRDIVYEYDNMTYTQAKDATYGQYYDLYNTDYYRSTIFNDQTQDRETIELRLTSSGEGRFLWMAGAYYEDVHDKWYYGAKVPGLENTTAWAAAQYYAYLYQTFYDYSCYCYQPNPAQVYPLPPTDVGYSNTLDRTTKQTAFFGEASFDLTSDLTIHGGIRWAEFDRDHYEKNRFPEGLVVYPDTWMGGDSSYRAVGKKNDTIYKIGVRYNIDDDRMLYGLYSQGFRVGGSNSKRAAGTGRVPQDYKGDFVDNYELGIKSQWLNNRLEINADVFYMEWTDYMESATFDQWWLTGTINAGNAETKGIELQAEWQATDRLLLSANVFVANPEFKDNFCNDYVGGVKQPCAVDASGNEIPTDIRAGMTMPNSAERLAHASIYYEIPDVFGGDAWLYYDFTYSDEIWNNVEHIFDNDRDGLAPSWTSSAFSAGLQFANHLDIELNVRNVFDQKGYSYVWTGEAGNAEVFDDPRYRRIRAQERPRTIFLTVRKGFGDI